MEKLINALVDKLPCVVAILGFAWVVMKYGFAYIKHRDEMEQGNRERTAKAFQENDERWEGLLRESYNGKDRRNNGR